MDQTFTAQATNCALTVSVSSASRDAAELTYTFENRGKQNIYLFNRLYYFFDDKTGLYKTDPNLINVEFEDDKVALSKKIIDVPPYKSVEKPNIPLVTMVEGGRSFKETIFIRMPVRPHTPYSSPKDDQLSSKPEAREASFEIGFFSATPEADKLAKTVDTTQGPASYFYPFPISGQTVIRAGSPSWRIWVWSMK